MNQESTQPQAASLGSVVPGRTGQRVIADATAIIDQNTGQLGGIVERLATLHEQLTGICAPSVQEVQKEVTPAPPKDLSDAVLPTLNRVASRNQEMTGRVNGLVTDLLEIL